jgi:hypothetical protein
MVGISSPWNKYLVYQLIKFSVFQKHRYHSLKEMAGVHGFKGSGVQGSILIPGLHLGCVFTIKASVSSGLIQHLKLNWQLPGKMNIRNEDFKSSMPSLSLTLNVEP